jgi:hypothetical protein
MRKTIRNEGILLLHLLFVLGPLDSFPSELIWNYGSYRQLVGLLRRVISPVARPLPTQDNTDTEETRTDIHASSGIRSHEPSVSAGEEISCLRPRDHCDRRKIFLFHNIQSLSHFYNHLRITETLISNLDGLSGNLMGDFEILLSICKRIPG